MSLPEGVRLRFDHISTAVDSIDDAFISPRSAFGTLIQIREGP